MMCKFEENQMKFSVSLLALGLGKPVDLGKVSPKIMRKSLVICQTSLNPGFGLFPHKKMPPNFLF